jgi:5'-3' exonuclease
VKPLLAVDGDSFAHRAYHSMPKSVKLNAVVGFTNMLMGLWDQTEPRAVAVGWDTLEVPTYRHEAFAGYQSGRVFDKSLLEQLDLLPELCTALRLAVGKAPGYEADDFLAAAVAAEEGRGGTTIVASGDRDTFQLVSDRTTVIQPIRGVSEMARIGPAEVRERYGVDPKQVPDFIALRGDPSDKLPGAKGVGPKTAASLLEQYGSLEQMLDDGRFSAQADELRLYKRIASMDAGAPLPERIPDGEPDWKSGAALVGSWGLNALAKRLEGRAQSTS